MLAGGTAHSLKSLNQERTRADARPAAECAPWALIDIAHVQSHRRRVHAGACVVRCALASDTPQGRYAGARHLKCARPSREGHAHEGAALQQQELVGAPRRPRRQTGAAASSALGTCGAARKRRQTQSSDCGAPSGRGQASRQHPHGRAHASRTRTAAMRVGWREPPAAGRGRGAMLVAHLFLRELAAHAAAGGQPLPIKLHRVASSKARAAAADEAGRRSAAGAAAHLKSAAPSGRDAACERARPGPSPPPPCLGPGPCRSPLFLLPSCAARPSLSVLFRPSPAQHNKMAPKASGSGAASAASATGEAAAQLSPGSGGRAAAVAGSLARDPGSPDRCLLRPSARPVRQGWLQHRGRDPGPAPAVGSRRRRRRGRRNV